jgi:hypothetical protein
VIHPDCKATEITAVQDKHRVDQDRLMVLIGAARNMTTAMVGAEVFKEQVALFAQTGVNVDVIVGLLTVRLEPIAIGAGNATSGGLSL